VGWLVGVVRGFVHQVVDSPGVDYVIFTEYTAGIGLKRRLEDRQKKTYIFFSQDSEQKLG